MSLSDPWDDGLLPVYPFEDGTVSPTPTPAAQAKSSTPSYGRYIPTEAENQAEERRQLMEFFREKLPANESRLLQIQHTHYLELLISTTINGRLYPKGHVWRMWTYDRATRTVAVWEGKIPLGNCGYWKPIYESGKSGYYGSVPSFKEWTSGLREKYVA